jgi:hypothetical protein
VDDVVPDTYSLKVCSVAGTGALSVPVQATYTVVGKAAPPSDVATFTATADALGIELAWTDIPDLDSSDYGIVEDATWSVGSAAWIAGTNRRVAPGLAGAHTFRIRARDTTGNVSMNDKTASVTISAPGTPSVTLAVVGSEVVASWQACATTHQIASYAVQVGGAVWGGVAPIGSFTTEKVTLPTTWSSAGNVFVKALDIAGNYSAAGVGSLTIAVPTAPTVSGSLVDTDALTGWTASTSLLPIASYEVRWGASWAAGTSVGKVTGTSLRVPVNWSGLRNWWVAATDSAGTVGTAGTAGVTINVPATVTPAATFEGPAVRLSWGSAVTSLPIDFYEVRRGASWTAGSSLGKAYTTGFTVPVDWSSTATFWVRAQDTAGNAGVEASVTVPITAPTTATPSASFSGADCVLTWAAATPGSLAIGKYEVRYGASWGVAAVVGFTTDKSMRVSANWVGARTFWLAAVDAAGGYGNQTSVVATVSAYSAPGSPALALSASGAVVFSWAAAAGGNVAIDYYEIRYGALWASAAVLGQSKTTTLTIPVTWAGARMFWVHAVDVQGNIGAAASAAITINAPGTCTPSATVVGVKVQLTWNIPGSSLPIDHYEVRYGASWAAGTPQTVQAGTDYRVTIDFTGPRTYWVAAVDTFGTFGTAGSASVTINAPAAPVVSAAVNQASFAITWTQPAASLPITNYELRYGASWGAGVLIGRSNTNAFSVNGTWSGARIIWVAAIDANGTTGAAGSVTASISAPPAPTNFKAQVIDNNVLLYWDQARGTMPTATYELRKGTSWADGTLIGQKAGGFTTVFETVGGTFTYWVAAIDTAGNYGAAASVAVVASQPPDYVFRASYDSTLNGTLSNAAAVAGAVLLPVSTSETFATHFTGHAWSTPQDQINAGFPVFAEPAVASGYYEETIDYGSVLSASKVTVSPNYTVIGAPGVTVTISSKLNIGDAWTDFVNVTSAFLTNFRYVKVKIVVTSAAGLDLLWLAGVNIRLDQKLKNDAGMVTCASADAGGTLVNFAVNFIDVSSITVTPLGTVPLVAMYSFLDVVDNATYSVTANVVTVTFTAHGFAVGGNVSLMFTSGSAPSGSYPIASTTANSFTVNLTTGNTSGNVSCYPEHMKVLLFSDMTGTRANGTASWTAKGY